MNKIYMLLLLLPALAMAQIKFEKGYFIDNKNVRTDCLIRNIDWKDTPTSFDYKLSDDSATESKTQNDVVVFSVGDNTYISATVAMDMSSDWTGKLTTNRNPIFENVRIFMKLMADGRHKLYRYDKNEMVRFFFATESQPVKQLIYKKFLVDNDTITATQKNNTFRQQLLTDVRCEGQTTKADVEQLDYTNKDLIGYFNKVNGCNGSLAVKQKDEKEATKKGGFRLKGSVFLGQHSLAFDHPRLTSHDFGSKVFVSLGAEGEYILPIWNNKWSVMGEASFASFNDEQTTEAGDNYKVKFGYILFSVGFRHYMFLSDNAKLFLNAVLNYHAIRKSSIIEYSDLDHLYSPYNFSPNSITPGLGIGVNYRMVDVELRYDIKSNPTPYSTVDYEYNNVKLIGRFKFL